MSTLTDDRTTIASQRETTSDLTFDKHFAVCLGLLIVAVLLVIASTFAGPPVVNMDLMPIAP